MQMVKENIQSAENSGVGTLNNEELALLNNAAGFYRKALIIPCTACDYCQPCPNGVLIPRNFSLLNDFNGTKDLKRTQMRYNMLLKENGAASLCKKCNECLEKCPQGINIPEMLEKVNAVIHDKKPISEVFPK
jgi:hypothetical protein